MKALITAAGRGTRLAPLTDDRPKPMLPIGGVPMLERIMSGVSREAGISQFVLVTGYKAEIVEGYFGDGSRWNWQVEYAPQPNPQGLGHAVLCARELLKDAPFLLTYGDIMLDAANYGKFAPPAPNSGGANILALNWVDDPWAGAAVYVDSDYRLLRIEEKPPRGTATTHWNNAGLFRLDPAIFGYLAALKPSARGEYELPDAISAMMRDGHTFQGVPLEGAWRDVGTLDDYAAINAEYEANAK